VVDFFCASHGLTVEVDGPIHQSQQERDAERQALLEACGFRVLRCTAADVEHNLPQVIAAITAYLLAYDTPLPPEGLSSPMALGEGPGEGGRQAVTFPPWVVLNEWKTETEEASTRWFHSRANG